jgi:23S rRNA pseudouridine2457 synthase
VPRLFLLNKPYGVLCAFTDSRGRRTLADFVPARDVYPAGRLDFDSEGLVLLTDTGWLQEQISDPAHKLPKVYWVQVEGEPESSAIERLEQGILLRDGVSRPVTARVIEPPALWPRDPPIRVRRAIPTTWLSLTLFEGRKRQVRRMTAALGHPTLRLVRVAVGEWELGNLRPGEWTEVPAPGRASGASRMARVL